MLSVDLTTSDCDGRAVVGLRGELDVVDADAVATAVAAAADRANVVIVDLAGLTFIDAGGVAALLRGREHARQQGGDVVLAAPQWQVRRVLTVAEHADAFSIHDNVAEAISVEGPTAVAAIPARSTLFPAT
jgi:anti-anti-sigma factor